MPKPIKIATAILAQNKNGSYALDLLTGDGPDDQLYRFELTSEAFESLKYDTHEGIEDDKLFGAENKLGPGIYRV
jgi:hypothetical protein